MTAFTSEIVSSVSEIKEFILYGQDLDSAQNYDSNALPLSEIICVTGKPVFDKRQLDPNGILSIYRITLMHLKQNLLNQF